MRLDLYARVSTEDQDVQQQIQHLRDWCRMNGHQIASETFDTQSGKVDLKDRKEFLRLLMNPKGDAMLVFNLDRLTRNWDSVTFIEKQFRDSWETYKLISTKDEINLENANGRLMFRIKLAINCQMPEDMLEKQAIGIARKKAQGGYTGRKKGALGKKIKTKCSRCQIKDTCSRVKYYSQEYFLCDSCKVGFNGNETSSLFMEQLIKK